MHSVQRRGNITLIALAILIAFAYIIPYGFLADVTAWRGAFLFWTLFGVAAIALIFRLVAGWKS